MRKTFGLIFLALFLSLVNQALASETTKEGSDFLAAMGERSLEGGDIQTAIHEFSKALMLNPDNEKAKYYLKEFHINEGIYQGTQTRGSQMGQLATDIRDYQQQVHQLEQERFHLEKRVDLLEDAIERKGDHQLLNDIEDYYRQGAFYNIDPDLPVDERLAALEGKHKEFLEYSYDKDRHQERTIDVMEAVLDYREYHLETAQNDVASTQIALAQNRKELLYYIDRLKRLTKEYDTYFQKRYYNAKEVERLEVQLMEARHEIDTLFTERERTLERLKDEVSKIKETM